MGNAERQVNAYERQKQALKLRLAGVSYEDIAGRLGYSRRSGAHAAVMAALKKTLAEPADELRTLELDRLDRMWLAIWPQVTAGHLGAIDRALRIMERRARLLGLDAPARADVTSGGEPLVIAVGGIDPHEDL